MNFEHDETSEEASARNSYYDAVNEGISIGREQAFNESIKLCEQHAKTWLEYHPDGPHAYVTKICAAGIEVLKNGQPDSEQRISLTFIINKDGKVSFP